MEPLSGAPPMGLHPPRMYDGISSAQTLANTIRLKSCPITLAYGASGTGKTTALHCGLALIGADDLRFYQQLTAAKVLQLCSSTSIPLGVDDPNTKTSFSKIIIDLYNGVKCGTISRGETKPKSTVVISTNVTPKDQLRYC